MTITRVKACHTLIGYNSTALLTVSAVDEPARVITAEFWFREVGELLAQFPARNNTKKGCRLPRLNPSSRNCQVIPSSLLAKRQTIIGNPENMPLSNFAIC